jgi:hypothetical protein
MKTTKNSENIVRDRALQMGYSIQECFAFEGCYYILDVNTSIVIAGAQDFLAWEEVVRWVVEADRPSTLQ